MRYRTSFAMQSLVLVHVPVQVQVFLDSYDEHFLNKELCPSKVPY